MEIDDPQEKDLDEFHVQALLLAKVIKRILNISADIQKTRMVSLEKKPIADFMSRMRVTSIEKFDSTTYISTVNFYKSEKDRVKGKTLGVLILYIEAEYIIEILKKLGYPPVEIDDHEGLENACGTICNLVAGKFKASMKQLNYIDLIFSHFSAYRNDVPNGVEYFTKRKEKYQIIFNINGQKRIIADLNLGKVPLY